VYGAKPFYAVQVKLAWSLFTSVTHSGANPLSFSPLFTDE